MTEKKKVYPSEEDLSNVNNFIRCTENNCKSIFTSESNLALHLQKTHKKDILKKQSDDLVFHCPKITCGYHIDKNFKTKKLLKQHYLKVHASRTFNCEKCKKGFSTECFRNAHLEYCGVIFTCNECESTYTSYESLKTHSRRKSHKIKEKIYFKKVCDNFTAHNSILNFINTSIIGKEIQPKKTIKVILLPFTTNEPDLHTSLVKSSEFEKNVSKPEVYCKKNQYTQTGYKYPQVTTGTQTLIDDEMNFKKVNLFKMQTAAQTNISLSSNGSDSNGCIKNTSDDFLQKNDKAEINSIEGTKKCLNDLENFENAFLNCNMETQTDAFDDLLSYCDYYNNTCTQTCNNLWLNNLELNNMDCQTEDFLLSDDKSSIALKNKMPSLDVNHMETQTEVDFDVWNF